jgi:hypothetical protein
MIVDANSAAASMDKLGAAFKSSFAKYVQAVVLDLTAEAKKEAPIDTGFLRASILPVKDGEYIYDVSANAQYAGYVHDGTRFIKPNPYMSRARLTIISRWSGRGFKIE